MNIAARAAARPPAPERTEFATRLVRVGPRSFAGHAFDPREPGRRLTIELLVDGMPVALARADAHDPVLAMGDGCHGFHVTLDDLALEPGSIVSARLANLDTPVGEPLLLAVAAPEPPGLPGALHWQGGLRFRGWMAPRDGDAFATITVDGGTIAEVPADGWTHAGPAAVPALDVHLPARFADGRVHRLVARNAAGEALAGSPLAFLAFPGEPELDAVLGRSHPPAFELLLPRSAPFSDYDAWRSRHPLPPVAAGTAEVAVLVAGDGAAPATLASLEDQTHPRWVAAILPPAGKGPSFAPAEALAFLEGDARKSTVVVFAMAGTRFHAGAIARLAAAVTAGDDTAAAYCDVEVSGRDGHAWPVFFPAFDRERFREQGYCAHVFALPAALARQALAAGAGDPYSLFLSAIDTRHPVVAVPGALATLPPLDTGSAAAFLAAAAGDGGEARPVRASSFFPSVRVLARRRAEGSVAILAPVASDRSRACLASLEPELRRAGIRPLLVTAAEPAAPPIGADRLAIGGDATRARLANAAFRACRAEFVCLVDDTMAATGPGWLDELLARAAGEDVGAVAPVVVGHDGLVRHAGSVLGPGFAVAPAFADAPPGDPAYGAMLAVARECSALEPGCILYHRPTVHRLGGMDETRFPVFFADADLCLRLRRALRRLIVTPHARLADARAVPPGRSGPVADRELRAFRARWGEALLADPFYTPLLALDVAPWTALAEPPRDVAPRCDAPPPMVDVPPGF